MISSSANRCIKVEGHGEHIVVVTLNRPEVLNALNRQVCEELRDFLLSIRGSEHSLRCVILTGEGGAFSSGGDLKARLSQGFDGWASDHEVAEDMLRLLVDSPVPWIAAVNGICFGGGLELALACDFIYASSHATFGQTECRIGIMPGGMGTINLPRAVGERRAKELIFSGSRFSAAEAEGWGLVNRIYDPDVLFERSLEAAHRISRCAPLAVVHAKKSIHFGLRSDLRTGYQMELALYYPLIHTSDRHEGVAAFNEKRAPRFSKS